MSSDKVVHLTKENFDQEAINSNIPVLVDFWATWCGPCRMVAPIIDQLADDFNGKAKIAKLDVDAERELAAKYKVMNIPTIIILKNGQVVERIIGARDKSFFAEALNKHI